MKILNFNMNIPEDVQKILNVLHNNNYEAYIVGGCVRDTLMGKIPKDWDITTNATPEQVKECFSLHRIIDTGLQHGTVTIVLNGIGYEITTYRIDGEYTNRRQPDYVIYSDNIRDDLKRRDFTINAIAYNPIVGFVDPFNGIKDIQRRIIRCVGDPNKRFQEDALRILRAVRFSNVLKFKIVRRTRKAMLDNAYLLENISIERINTEFSKTIVCDICSLFDVDYKFNAMAEMFIFKNKYHSVFIPYQDIPLAGHLALRLQDISIFEVKKVLEDLRYDNKTINLTFDIRLLLAYNNLDSSLLSKSFIKHNFLMKYKIEAIFIWLNILSQKADVCVWDIPLRRFINKFKKLLSEIFIKNECFSLNKLNINGDKLKELGYQGIDIGFELDKLLDMVVDELIPNDLIELTSIANDDYLELKHKGIPFMCLDGQTATLVLEE